jgi:hypothetical protein
MEIANPEDQLALWKLVSDKMWDTFAQQVSQSVGSQQKTIPIPQSRAAIPTKSLAKHVPKAQAKTAHKSQPKAKGRVAKPKRTPMAPAPKQLPKPGPQQLTPTQAAKQQTQQHQQIAQHLHKEISKSNPQQKIYPQPPTPTHKLPTPTVPMTNGYDERDKDELVMHSRAQNPFKTVAQTKSALTGQKRGF